MAVNDLGVILLWTRKRLDKQLEGQTFKTQQQLYSKGDEYTFCVSFHRFLYRADINLNISHIRYGLHPKNRWASNEYL